MGFKLFPQKEKFHEEISHNKRYIIPITPRMSYLVILRYQSSEDFIFEVSVLLNDSKCVDSGFSCNLLGTPFAWENIPAKHLQKFVFVDDRLFSNDPLNSMSLLKNTKKTQKMIGKNLCNIRNENSPLSIYTILKYKERMVSTGETKMSLHYKIHGIVHDDTAPCSRVGHSFVVSSEKECGYLFGGFAELKTEDSKGFKKGNSIFYPLDDCWKLDLQSLKWEKIFDCSVPIPSLITSETKFPDYFMRCEAFYDQKTKLIVGYGERMKFQINGTSDAQAVGTAFIIDPALKIREIVGTLDTNFIRILPDVYVERDSTTLNMLCTPKSSSIKSYGFWNGDISRVLKEKLMSDVLEDKVKTKVNHFWKSGISVNTDNGKISETIQTNNHQNSISDLTWDDLVKFDWFMEFSSRFQNKTLKVSKC